MADKRATIFIIDLGASTGECHNGRVESDLDYGMQYVWDKVADNMAKPSWGVGVIGFRTDETDNKLADDDNDDSGAYENIAVLKQLGPLDMPGFKDLKEKTGPSKTNDGDAISAIVLGITLIEEFTTLKSGKPGKYARKIVLLTDGEGSIDDEDIDPIAAKINEVGIDLVILQVPRLMYLTYVLTSHLVELILMMQTLASKKKISPRRRFVHRFITVVLKTHLVLEKE